ncbi:MAG: glycosyltransferase family 4 protein [Candidatus Sulfotelmatobacter sp.]
MNSREQSRHPTVAVLLSGREQFSRYFGGAVARWTYEVYSCLSDRLDVTVFGFPTGREDLYPVRHETSEAWRVCNLVARIPVARRYEETLWLRSLLRRLRRFEVVHIHNRPQWVEALRKMGYGGSVVLHLHNDHLGHWSGPTLDALASGLDAIVTCSDYLRSTFVPKSRLLNDKAYVVLNGANLQLFCPREEVREPKTIFFVGRFDPEKGVLQLLQAYEKLLDTHPDAKLVIGGTTNFGTHRETSYVRQVRELADSLNKNKHAQVHFTGYLDHDKDLPTWFQKATVFACPSLFQEPFGLVNAEAMACATPVVGSNRGGIPQVLGDAGRLADPENVNAFAATLSDLLTRPEYCRQLGQAGYGRCQKLFDWRVVAESWLTLLDCVRHKTTSCECGE